MIIEIGCFTYRPCAIRSGAVPYCPILIMPKKTEVWVPSTVGVNLVCTPRERPTALGVQHQGAGFGKGQLQQHRGMRSQDELDPAFLFAQPVLFTSWIIIMKIDTGYFGTSHSVVNKNVQHV